MVLLLHFAGVKEYRCEGSMWLHGGYACNACWSGQGSAWVCVAHSKIAPASLEGCVGPKCCMGSIVI
jgi:hypothetical protein